MGDVVQLNNLITNLQISPDKVLEGALSMGLSEVVIAGYDKEGNSYIASSEPLSQAVFLMEMAKHELLKGE